MRRRLLFAALSVLLLVAPLAAEAALRITDVDLIVPAVPGEQRRAQFPSHKVFVGDHASVDLLLFHDGSVQGWSTSWSTTAPTTGLTQHAPQTGLLTGPFTHTLPAGGATFTTAGHYRLSVSLHSQAGDANASFDIEVVELQAVVAPLQVACLAPAVRWVTPAANGQICLGQNTTLTVSPTFHGCEPHTAQVLVEEKGGKWAVLGTKTAAPWSFTHKFTVAGPVHLKAVVKDKNGATGEAEVTATVSQCLDASRFKH